MNLFSVLTEVITSDLTEIVLSYVGVFTTHHTTPIFKFFNVSELEWRHRVHAEFGYIMVNPTSKSGFKTWECYYYYLSHVMTGRCVAHVGGMCNYPENARRGDLIIEDYHITPGGRTKSVHNIDIYILLEEGETGEEDITRTVKSYGHRMGVIPEHFPIISEFPVRYWADVVGYKPDYIPLRLNELGLNLSQAHVQTYADISYLMFVYQNIYYLVILTCELNTDLMFVKLELSASDRSVVDYAYATYNLLEDHCMVAVGSNAETLRDRNFENGWSEED